jgi:hypothetical protein
MGRALPPPARRSSPEVARPQPTQVGCYRLRRYRAPVRLCVSAKQKIRPKFLFDGDVGRAQPPPARRSLPEVARPQPTQVGCYRRRRYLAPVRLCAITQRSQRAIRIRRGCGASPHHTGAHSATGRRGLVGGYNGRRPSAHGFRGFAEETEARHSPRGQARRAVGGQFPQTKAPWGGGEKCPPHNSSVGDEGPQILPQLGLQQF